MKTTWAVLILGLICAVAACSLSNSGDDDDDDSDDDASDDDTDSDDDDDEMPEGGIDLSGDWDCYYNRRGEWIHRDNPTNYDGCRILGCGLVCGEAGSIKAYGVASINGDILTILDKNNDETGEYMMDRCTRAK